MKFKVGDKVRVKKNLIVNEIYNGFLFVSRMEKQKGEIVTITKVYSDTNSYMIMEDLGRYVWTEEMLESVRQ